MSDELLGEERENQLEEFKDVIDGISNMSYEDYTYFHAYVDSGIWVGLDKYYSFCCKAIKYVGLQLEFGTGDGRTAKLLMDRLPSKEELLYTFDWFQGLPEAWFKSEKGAFAQIIEGDINPPVLDPDKAKIIFGLFEDSLPSFINQPTSHSGFVTFIHIDCDLYSSTKTIFTYLKDQISEGTVILFDESHGYEGWENHEFKAFKEFLNTTTYKAKALAFAATDKSMWIITD